MIGMSELNANETLPPPVGGMTFMFKEIENPEGGVLRTIAFTEVDVRPRSYDELQAARLHESITIPLEMYNGRILETNVEGVDLTKYAHITATLVSPFTAKAIGLVRGGWLPSTLAASRSNAVVLPDRNIISQIVGRFDAGKGTGLVPDFLDLFENSPVRIDPILYALEGNRRSLPNPELAQNQLDESVEKLRKALPAATIIVGPDSLTRLLGMIEDIRPSMDRKQQFLMRLAPKLASQVARRDMDARWDEVLETAADCGVPRGALVVLAVLSGVINSDANAARRLLKFKAAYGPEDAYNALADLNALEVLLYRITLYPKMQTQLCTGDRNLALFWAGIGADDFERDGKGMRCTFTPHPAILPECYAERWAEEVSNA